MKRILVYISLGLIISFSSQAYAEENTSVEESFMVANNAYNSRQYDKAIPIFLSLAKNGHIESQSILVHAYQVGNGVVQDYAESEKWCILAAEQGHLPSQFWLGLSYYTGHDYGKNMPEAFRWFRKAAEHGTKRGALDAQKQIADMYRDGNGVPQNYTKALEWYNRSAEAGLPEAQVGLSVMYHEGLGLPQDNIKAFAWASIAAAGDDSYIELRNIIEKRMSPIEIKQAQQLSEILWEKYGENTRFQGGLTRQFRNH